MAEPLHLKAEIEDRFSKPLRAMEASVTSFVGKLLGAHDEGEKHAKKHASAFNELQKRIGETASTVREGVMPAFEAWGLSAISTTAAVGGLAEAMKNFGSQAQSWKFISTETGIAVNQLRVYEQLAVRVGSSQGEMDAGLKSFAANMAQLRRGLGATYQELLKQPAGTVAFANALRGTADNATALKEVLDALGHMTGADQEQQKRNVLQAFGLPLDLARLSGQKLQQTLADLAKEVRPLTAAQVAAGEAAYQSFLDLSDSAEQLKNEISADLSPALKDLLDKFSGFVDKDGPAVRAMFTDIAGAIKNADWSEYGADIKLIATDANDAAQEMGGWKTVLEGIVAIKFASWLYGTLGPLGRFVTLVEGLHWLTQEGPSKLFDKLGVLPHDKNADTSIGGTLGNLKKDWGALSLKAPLPFYHQMPSPDHPGGPPGLFQKQSYHPTTFGGASLIPAAYTSGGSSSTVERLLTAAVAEGTERGFENFFTNWAQASQGGGGGGLTHASFSPSGGGGSFVGGGSAPGAATPASRSVGGFGIPTGSPAHVSRNLATNQQQAYAAARAQGLSDSAARILVGNMSGESLANPRNNHWDVSHMSQGIVQWDPTRANAIRDKFGALPKDMSVGDQTKAAIWEMKAKYPGAWSTLNNENLSAQQRMFGVVHGYERPADPMAATQQRMRFLRGLNVHDDDTKSGGLMGSARGAGLVGGSSKVEGNAALAVTLKGFPRGTRTAMSADGMFKRVSLNSGSVPWADQGA